LKNITIINCIKFTQFTIRKKI